VFIVLLKSTETEVRQYYSRSETRLQEYFKWYSNRTLVGTLSALYRYFSKTLRDTKVPKFWYTDIRTTSFDILISLKVQNRSTIFAENQIVNF